MNIDRKIRDIKDIKVQGAENIAKAGLAILRGFAAGYKGEDSVFFREFIRVSKKVSSARPTEPALRREIYFVVEKVKASRSPKKDTLKICDFYIKGLASIKDEIALFGSRKITDGDVVMTHCHSNTVMAIFRAAKKAGRKFRVIVTETRPLFQGKKTAEDLERMHVPFLYIIDSAEAQFMRQATKAMVGADAILSDGSIVNKIGTAQMAIIAKEFCVPFFVACGTHKFDDKTILGFDEPIEERAKSEVWNSHKANIKNPAFDITSKRYLSGIITERGVFSPDALVAMISSESSDRRFKQRVLYTATP